MARSFAVLAVLAVFLAPTASAKELFRSTVCGADSCGLIVGENRLEQLLLGGQRTVISPSTANYFTVDYVVREGTSGQNRFAFLYVPSKMIIGISGEPRSLFWLPVTSEADAMRAAIGNLEPYRVPRAWPGEPRAPAPSPSSGFGRLLVTSLLAAFGLSFTAALLVRGGRRPGPASG